MPIYQLPKDTGINFSEGPEQIFIYVAGQVPIFFPLVLFALFMIVAITGFVIQEKREGKGNFAMWASVGGYITSGVAFILFLVQGIINILTLSTVLALTFLATILYLMSPNK